MILEEEKKIIAKMADEGYSATDIAKEIYIYDTPTNKRNINEFINTYECDQLRGRKADYTLLEDWHLEVVDAFNAGNTPSQITRIVFGESNWNGDYKKVIRFLKTSLAYELIQSRSKKESVEDEVSEEDANTISRKNLNILYWDIETSPCSSYHYQHWKVNIRQDQAIKQSHLLSISYAFNDEEPIGFKLDPEDVKNENDLTLVVNMIEAIEKADVIVGYNSKNFDLKTLNTRALFWDLPPIKPTKHIDLYEQVRKSFRFPSNSLGNVSAYLQLEGKLITDNGLWRRCMEFWNTEDCEKALDDMLTYNKQDIVATRDLYYRMRGWTKQTANLGAMLNNINNDFVNRCPKCTSLNVVPLEGKLAFTNVKAYQMYRCTDCGDVSRISASGLVGCPAS